MRRVPKRKRIPRYQILARKTEALINGLRSGKSRAELTVEILEADRALEHLI